MRALIASAVVLVLAVVLAGAVGCATSQAFGALSSAVNLSNHGSVTR